MTFCNMPVMPNNPWEAIPQPVSMEVPQAHYVVANGPCEDIVALFTGAPILCGDERGGDYLPETIAVAMIGRVNGQKYPRVLLANYDSEGRGDIMVEDSYNSFMGFSSYPQCARPESMEAVLVAYDSEGQQITEPRDGSQTGVIIRELRQRFLTVNFRDSFIEDRTKFPSLAVDLVTGKLLSPGDLIVKVPTLIPASDRAWEIYKHVRGLDSRHVGGSDAYVPCTCAADLRKGHKPQAYRNGTTLGLKDYLTVHSAYYAPRG